MATITIGNRTMDAGELRAEIVSFSSDLAKKARVDEPLPEGQDLSESEDTEIQTQIHAMHVLPRELVDLMMAALCANYAPKIATALHRTSRETQPKAFATYVQLLSLIPEASQEPYYRLFLSSPDSKGLANLLGDAFQKGIQWRRPSGPGTICGLLIELLFWCDPSEGDDSKAPMDAEIRKQVLAKTTALISNPSFTQLPIEQRADIERLNGVLQAIEQMPGDTYVKGAKETLTAQSGEGVCANEGCGQESKMRCSRCKTVEYCGQKCQSKHWKQTHKIRCFPPP